MGTATLFALFMPTFAAVLAPFERVVTNAAFRRPERTAATVPSPKSGPGGFYTVMGSKPPSKPSLGQLASMPAPSGFGPHRIRSFGSNSHRGVLIICNNLQAHSHET